MATQPTNAPEATERVATKAQVMNALVELAKSNAIKGLNRSQVKEAVINEITITDGGDPYVVPDAVFTEILAVETPTDILETFDTVPLKRWTVLNEMPSDADLARAGVWSKGEQKAIQESDLEAQKLETDFLYKMQEISYADMQEDYGDVLIRFIREELPRKLREEEERAFIVGDGRASNNPRKIKAVVSLKDAAADSANVHVANYNGSADVNAIAALVKAQKQLKTTGVRHLVLNPADAAELRLAGMSSASGLPFSNATLADVLGVSGIYEREYVDAGTAYVWTAGRVKRLTGGNNGETIEQYDIDYNNRKIEFIRPVGGAATGLYSAVAVQLPSVVSA